MLERGGPRGPRQLKRASRRGSKKRIMQSLSWSSNKESFACSLLLRVGSTPHVTIPSGGIPDWDIAALDLDRHDVARPTVAAPALPSLELCLAYDRLLQKHTIVSTLLSLTVLLRAVLVKEATRHTSIRVTSSHCLRRGS